MTTLVYQIGLQFKSNNHADTISKLYQGDINKNSKKIKKIISGAKFDVYCDDNQNIWTAGINTSGQCCSNQYKDIDGYYNMKYFKDNNIIINKICTTPQSSTVFWITNDNKIYGNGSNENYQLGIDDMHKRNQAVLIQQLQDKNVVDIQPSSTFSIALCSNESINTFVIIQFWSKKHKIDIPEVIANEISKYSKINKVLITGKSWVETTARKTWMEEYELRDMSIVKVAVGAGFAFFLDSNGSVFGWGDNDYGQLGLGYIGNDHYNHDDTGTDIKPIKYFEENGIKIQDMECGSRHTVMIDYERKVWIFGSNHWGQIGGITNEDIITTPIEMFMFRDCQVEMIKIGASHNYIKCKGDRHYLWGSNESKECLNFDEEARRWSEPHDIKQIVFEQTNGKKIKDVYVGYDNTTIVVFSE